MAINPFLSKAVANKAVSLAKTAMQNEAVRQQLRDAPDNVRQWARSLQGAPGGPGGPGAWAGLARLDPTARFSQPALERRLDALEANVDFVFEGVDNPARTETLRAVREIRRAIIVAAPLPLLNRKKVFIRIDGEVSALEQALVDAVLPRSTSETAETASESPDPESSN
ncbi:MAG: hypothetical protein ABIW84_05505 [Ilumatobacteraceae bacterium]